MGKPCSIPKLFICLMVMAVPMVYGIAQGPKAAEDWFRSLCQGKKKVTVLHFFFHDVLSGDSPTAMEVAHANTTFTSSPFLFGLINMADDPLTIGPDPNSKLLGRAQGLYGSADLHEVGLLVYMNFVFTEGKHNGSTLSLLGRNPPFHDHREMSIVGGTGVFRLARGIAIAKTYSFNTETRDAVVEYNVTVVHY